jgi:hypothetical protein
MDNKSTKPYKCVFDISFEPSDSYTEAITGVRITYRNVTLVLSSEFLLKEGIEEALKFKNKEPITIYCHSEKNNTLFIERKSEEDFGKDAFAIRFKLHSDTVKDAFDLCKQDLHYLLIILLGVISSSSSADTKN